MSPKIKRPSPLAAGRFVDELLSLGRYNFPREEAQRRLGTSAAAYMSLHRLASDRADDWIKPNTFVPIND